MFGNRSEALAVLGAGNSTDAQPKDSGGGDAACSEMGSRTAEGTAVVGGKRGNGGESAEMSRDNGSARKGESLTRSVCRSLEFGKNVDQRVLKCWEENEHGSKGRLLWLGDCSALF